MRGFVVGLFLVGGLAWAQNQTCIIPSPPAPPIPRVVIVNLPSDGGTVGCTIQALVSGGASPTEQPIGNTKCATAVQMARQAAANDNGWNDGGSP